MSFATLGLNDALLQALNARGYSAPTNIQRQAIPVILQGRDLLAAAQTGTGKTASFVLPMLERLAQGETVRKKRMRGLILVPTRELALQVHQMIGEYGAHTHLRSMAMFGGVDDKAQKQQLIEGVDIVVATPGRLLDLYAQRALHFDEVSMLVLDEADRMLDLGFIETINQILAKLPENIQHLLFSATLSPRVRDLAKSAIHDPEEITIAAKEASKANIHQWLIPVDKDMKSSLLSHLIQTEGWKQTLIFIETKHGAAKLVAQLEKRGIRAEAFHSGRSQAVREQVLADFKAGRVDFLVATGVGARGIDIHELPRVVNYDLPYPADEYVHRIGRTGRADAQGEAVSFLSKDNFKNLCMIESRLGHLIERRDIEGFEPKKPIPISILNYVPKAKRDGNPASSAQGDHADKNNAASRRTRNPHHRKSRAKPKAPRNNGQ
ncbi:DEAD/DEAH box helicase [Vibrio sp. SM6]|uniref:DEAD/DEAH box helicase n=1 Tax=Vibrio agarilyticus TaxID=2726741 RepID=A0A7X8TNG3_9VIBR|nr:DEAD/DEAH box helicase [Vibrio agarilyticus]NLS11976.1 DEAD/DEAH box helicase [Vibrio agarilyticus]